MNVQQAEWYIPGAVPDSLAAVIARDDAPETNRPIKRRKVTTSGPQSLAQLNGLSEDGIPQGYIPLARVKLQLNYEKMNPNLVDSPAAFIDLPHRLPVLISTARNIGAPALRERTPGNCYKLEFMMIPEKNIIFSETSGDPQILAFGENQLHLASSTTCADYFYKNAPRTCHQATLHCLPDMKSFRLELVLLWSDSLESPDVSHLQDMQLEIFSKYILQEPQDAFKHDAGRGRQYQERQLNTEARQWTPRDFYEHVHVPPDTPETSADVKCEMVECQLYPFQRRAVRWLLEREGMEINPDGRVLPIRKAKANRIPASFRVLTDVDGRPYFASHLLMSAARGFPDWYGAEERLKGGILAEEMGLGKTVEMITLTCLNRRQLSAEQSTSDDEGKALKPSGATLIITPPAILEQWKQEVELHAPALRVFHYTGIQRHPEMSDDALAKMISGYDIVLTTYNVLSREVHYTGHGPDRSLRHRKRFKPRRTPLTRISWWRVCLDEAQMVESGVSNAAKVANLIPRHNAWAVTGTPLRKNMDDLFGLLLFLHYEPFCYGGVLRTRLCGRFQSILASIVNTIALRHNKNHVRSELDLPPQKRVVITIPFTAVEGQHYNQLYERMCEECGLDLSGSPLNEDWDPEDQSVIERMRTWLTRLRHTCLHPEFAGRNRRGFLANNGPLRSVSDVLETMIDQNDTLVRAEERALLLSQLRRGQLLENATRRQEALGLWKASLDHASAIVKDCRAQLDAELAKYRASAASSDGVKASVDEESEEMEMDKNFRIGTFRQRLRAALEVEHICMFFMGNAYYQIKTDPKLTEPESEEYTFLERREVESYEAAKLIRKEILIEVSQRVGRYMKDIKEKTKKRLFVRIPQMKPQINFSGIEARRVLDRLEDLCDAMNDHAAQYNQWRDAMANLLSQSLIDQEEETELEGDEYEKSTKHQDEMYVYMEALRAMFADRHDAITGQKNILIAHEVKNGIIQAQNGEGPSPPLFLSVMNRRSTLKPDPELGSLRGILAELRSLATSLEWQESGGSSRASAELELVNIVLDNATKMNAEQVKVTSGLEREVEMFRDTMNYRLEYYRQLQQISDTVAPYDEESVGKPLDEASFAKKLRQEKAIDEKISSLKAKHRYLIHLRDEPVSDDSSRICIICQTDFEIGVLTVCGHKYCKDCLQMWWSQHRTCPACKKRLRPTDFHEITYRPQDLVVQEEKTPTKLEPGPERSLENSIYTDVSTSTLKEINGIELSGFYGSKIDALARHILWLRMHEPGSKSVVFSQYRGFLTVLGAAFSRFKIGHSSIDNKGGIEDFKSNPATECFLLHARAHSSGLNLVNATHVFLCEPLINTAIELQAIARVHRIGQHRPTTVWMYLVSGTVEESIYDLSVSRRLAHIVAKKREEEAHSLAPKNGTGTTGAALDETAIDSANSMEMQDASLARLMAAGVSSGELVKKDDLWQCLFGDPTRNKDASHPSMGAQSEVGKFLRSEAAEQRAAKPVRNGMMN